VEANYDTEQSQKPLIETTLKCVDTNDLIAVSQN